MIGERASYKESVRLCVPHPEDNETEWRYGVWEWLHELAQKVERIGKSTLQDGDVKLCSVQDRPMIEFLSFHKTRVRLFYADNIERVSFRRLWDSSSRLVKDIEVRIATPQEQDEIVISHIPTVHAAKELCDKIILHCCGCLGQHLLSIDCGQWSERGKGDAK